MEDGGSSSGDHSALLKDLKAFFLPKMDSLQVCVDTLTSEVRSFSTRLTLAEQRISGVEDSQQESDVSLKNLLKQNQYLKDKVEDLENRSRRNNLRIVGVPETVRDKDLLEFVASTLPKLLGMSQEYLLIDIERSHRIGPDRYLGNSKEKPRQVIFKCLNYPDKLTLLRAYRAAKEIKYEDHRLLLFQDFSVEVTPISSQAKTPDCFRSQHFPLPSSSTGLFGFGK